MSAPGQQMVDLERSLKKTRNTPVRGAALDQGSYTTPVNRFIELLLIYLVLQPGSAVLEGITTLQEKAGKISNWINEHPFTKVILIMVSTSMVCGAAAYFMIMRYLP